MGNLNLSLRRIPFWAYLLVILVIAVNSVYLYYKGQVPADGLSYRFENGQGVVVGSSPDGAGYIAGIRSGDIVISVNSRPFETWLNDYQGKRSGDRVSYQILRNNEEMQFRVVLSSYFSNTQVSGLIKSVNFSVFMLQF